MSLNIKNEETCRLAAELARITGQSMTGAITSALRERLARGQRLHGVEVRAQKLLAIGERCAERWLQATPTCRPRPRGHEVALEMRAHSAL